MLEFVNDVQLIKHRFTSLIIVKPLMYCTVVVTFVCHYAYAVLCHTAVIVFFFKIFKRIIIVQGKLDSYREKVVGGEELNKDQKVCFTHTLMSGDDLTEMVTYIAI